MLQFCLDIGDPVNEDPDPILAAIADAGDSQFAERLRQSNADLLAPEKNGHFGKWRQAYDSLPKLQPTCSDFSQAAVTVGGECDEAARLQIEASLQAFHPWRKGPFDLFGVSVDAEWRSNLKWQRIASHIDLAGGRVLDVGSGNGYYGWRMLGAGATSVLGLEPYPLYNMQHAVVKRYLPEFPNHVLAGTDRVLATELRSPFDAVFSMGVFYHCKNPVGHLESLRNSVRSGGKLVLETLVVDGDVDTVLVPSGRYAKMRNVWLIPSTLMLERLIGRTGFRNVQVVDVTATTKEEQRTTDWMTFESLADFLDPVDSKRTIEGHPAPLRATLIAERR